MRNSIFAYLKIFKLIGQKGDVPLNSLFGYGPYNPSLLFLKSEIASFCRPLLKMLLYISYEFLWLITSNKI